MVRFGLCDLDLDAAVAFEKFCAEAPAGRLVRGRGRSPRQGGLALRLIGEAHALGQKDAEPVEKCDMSDIGDGT